MISVYVAKLNQMNEDAKIFCLKFSTVHALIMHSNALTQCLWLVEDGFCNAQTEITASPDRGRYEWAEARSDTKQYLGCAYGPKRARATRYCLSRGNWSVSNTSSCATALTLKFRNLRKIINEVSLISFTAIIMFIIKLYSSILPLRM